MTLAPITTSLREQLAAGRVVYDQISGRFGVSDKTPVTPDSAVPLPDADQAELWRLYDGKRIACYSVPHSRYQKVSIRHE